MDFVHNNIATKRHVNKATLRLSIALIADWPIAALFQYVANQRRDQLPVSKRYHVRVSSGGNINIDRAVDT